MTNRSRVCVVMLLTLAASVGWAGPSDPVSIPDQNLLLVVQEKLGITGIPTEAEMLNLAYFEASGRGITDLTGLEYAHNIWYAGLAWNQISNLGPLAGMHSLTTLSLQANRISDITVLGQLDLVGLSLAENSVEDISPLATSVNLRSLYLDSNRITSIAVASNMPNLELLSAPHNPIEDLEPLSGCVNLTTLGLGDNKISSISALKNLVNLQTLSLFRNSITDISPLQGLVGLRLLDLEGSQISDLSPLASLVNLEHLELRGTGISDLSALERLVNLKWLSLRGDNITNISVVSHLTGLEVLSLDENWVLSDISPLANLPNLREVWLRENQVCDVSALGTLPRVQIVDLPGNRVEDIAPLSLLTGLTWLRLGANPLNKSAYCTYIPMIQEKNPGIYLVYNENPYGPCTPPVITNVSASPSTLWPANHKMVAVTVQVEAADDQDPSPTRKIVEVSCNEPVNGPGDGNTQPDWEITGPLTVKLRAERSGFGVGRIYTIHVECTNASGKALGLVKVAVPHDQGKKK